MGVRAIAITAGLVIAVLTPMSADAARPASGIEAVVIGANPAATDGQISVHWVATCTGRIKRLRSSGTFLTPFVRSARRPDHFPPYRSDYVIPPRIGESWFSARRSGANRWTGVFETKAKVLRHGKVIARCHVPRTSWSATAPRARVSYRATRPDLPFTPVLPRSVSLSMPKDAISWDGFSHALRFHFGDEVRAPGFEDGFDLALTAPGSRRVPLRPGRYRNNPANRLDDSQPIFEFSGNHQACLPKTSDFTIHDITFAPRDALKTLDVTYAISCSGGGQSPPSSRLSGRLVYRH